MGALQRALTARGLASIACVAAFVALACDGTSSRLGSAPAGVAGSDRGAGGTHAGAAGSLDVGAAGSPDAGAGATLSGGSSGASGGSSGASGGSQAGGNTSGGTSLGGSEQSGAGGAAARAGASNAGAAGAGGGARTPIPGESPRETEILAPLATDDATIAAASGAELVALAESIGLARGYANCRCALSPSEAPADEEMFDRCAPAESGVPYVAYPNRARCITERMQEVPGFEDYLRCLTVLSRISGLAELTVCSEPGSRPEPPDVEPCTRPPGADVLLTECISAYYCADQTRVVGYRCDGVRDCSDLSDESGCYTENGQDQFLCGDEIWNPLRFCSELSECGFTNVPPYCDPTLLGRFPCGDGPDLPMESVCDRQNDCRNGADETRCLR